MTTAGERSALSRRPHDRTSTPPTRILSLATLSLTRSYVKFSSEWGGGSRCAGEKQSVNWPDEHIEDGVMRGGPVDRSRRFGGRRPSDLQINSSHRCPWCPSRRIDDRPRLDPCRGREPEPRQRHRRRRASEAGANAEGTVGTGRVELTRAEHDVRAGGGTDKQPMRSGKRAGAHVRRGDALAARPGSDLRRAELPGIL